MQFVLILGTEGDKELEETKKRKEEEFEEVVERREGEGEEE